MKTSIANACGVLETGHTECLARRGRAHATISFALCNDGKFRYGLNMMYSYGGFSSPIRADGSAFQSRIAARTAAIQEMLAAWHKPYPSDPVSVNHELRELREQAEGHLIQPSLF
jgi:hypothetical protein